MVFQSFREKFKYLLIGLHHLIIRHMRPKSLRIPSHMEVNIQWHQQPYQAEIKRKKIDT